MHKINTDMEQENKPLAHLNFKKLTWIAATLAALITLIAYLPALQNGFVNWDDDILVYENPTLRPIDIPFIGWALTNARIGLWNPMLWLSFALDYTAWGLNPFGYHITNTIFHSINTFLVFILVTLLLLTGGYGLDKKNLIAVTVTALLFAIHPLHVESVAWVTERKDVLYSFFFLASLLVYLRYASTNLKRYYLLSLIFFILSLMSKPMAVSLPAVLLILDFCPLRRLTWEGGLKKNRRVLVEKLPFLLLGILFAALTVWVHPGLEPQGAYPLKERIFVAAHSFISYLVKMALPFNLAPIYPTLSIVDIFSFEYIRPFIGLTAIIILYIWPSKRSKVFSVIWLYYTATLMPVLGQVGAQHGADRYTYLPSLGPFLMFGIGIGYLFERCSKRQQAALATTLIFLFGAMASKTQAQISVWKDSVTLWTYEIKLFSNIEKAYNNRGTAYREIGDQQLAIKDFDTVIKLNPKYTEAYYNRGNAHNSLGNYQQAIKDFSEVIKLNPPLTRLVIAYNNRGIAYRSLGIYKKAIKDFDMAITINPGYQKAYNNRGSTYMILNNYHEAIKDYSMAIKLNPQDAIAYRNREIAYRNLGDHEQTLKSFNKADELSPD